MKMPTSAELGGIHPRSEQLIELTRSYDRGKTERPSVEKQIEKDAIELVELQDESGFENFTDGAFSWQDQLRPIVETRRSEEHTSELQSHSDLVCRLLLEKKKNKKQQHTI